MMTSGNIRQFNKDILAATKPKVVVKPKRVKRCSYCGSGLFNEKGDCQKCGL